MNNLSVIIPSRKEKFLRHTIEDVCAKAQGDIDIFVVLDSYEPSPSEIVLDKRITYLRLSGDGEKPQKRQGINLAVSLSTSKYIMSLDAHCMMCDGFDKILTSECDDNWVVIPRRHRLDAENWSIQPQCDNRPPIDYEYFMYPGKVGKNGLHGFKWDARTLSKSDVMVDDTLTFQGSCWLMTRDWFNKMGFMQVNGYTGWGQEAEEIGLTTRLHGGRIITNKNAWYAHLHKGKKYGRMYRMSKHSVNMCNKYSYNYWVNEHREFFINVIRSFMPVPGWSEDESKWEL